MRQRAPAIILIVCILLSACQSAGLQPQATGEPSATPDPSATPRPSATPPPTATPTPAWLVPDAELSGLKLRFLHPWTGELSRQVDRLVDEFNQTNPWNVHVMAASTGSVAGLFDDVTAMMEAGDVPRLVAATPEQILTWAQFTGQVVNLGLYLDDTQAGLNRAAIPPVFWQPAESDGQVLGMPALANARGLVYNQSWAQELGFAEPPDTPAEFQKQACAAADANATDDTRDNDGTGGWFVDTEPDTMLAWLRAFGVEDLASEGELDYDFSQPGGREAFVSLRELMDAGCIWVGRQPTPYDYFAARNALFYSGSLTELEAQTSAQNRFESTDEWTLIPFPAEDGAGEWLVSVFSFAVLEGPPAENLAAWYFIRWMAEPDRLARLAAAEGYLPANSAAYEALAGAGRLPEQWAIGWPAVEAGAAPPRRGSWRIARMVLEDAAWQSLQSTLTAEQIPGLLTQLDATVREVGQQLGYSD